MASILKRVYRIFNGTDWDTAHFETDSEQVKHDTTTVKAKLDTLKSGALATVVNNLTTTAANTVLDGRQGKALNDKITAINSTLKEQLNSNAKSLTNSTYYPSSTIYRSGQVVYLRCSGVTEKEIPANTELTIATEGTVPEEYRGNNDMIFYPIISLGGKTIRVFIGTNGKVTFTSPEKLEVGFGINMHVAYMTGKSNFS